MRRTRASSGPTGRFSRADQVARDLARAYLISEVVSVSKKRANRFVALMPESMAIALSRDPRVESVEQDVWVTTADVQHNAPWNLDRIDQGDGGAALNGQFSYGPTGAGVDIYILDSTVRVTHEQFGGRATDTGICKAPPEQGPCDPGDPACIEGPPPPGGGGGEGAPPCSTPCQHGTFVAGIAGGSWYGVAKGANLRSVGAVNCAGTGFGSFVADAIDDVVTLHQQSGRPSVLNMSLHAQDGMDELDAAVLAAINAGITVVAAAGNDNNAPGETPYDYSPTRLESVIVVGATNSADERWVAPPYGSNFGPALDLFAPGAGVFSALAGSDTAYNTTPVSATSWAAPIVSGVAAMYLQVSPFASHEQVRNALVLNATSGKIPNPGSGSPNLIVYSGFIEVPPPPPPPPPPGGMFADSAVRGCINWSWWSPIYKATAAECLTTCQANNANACEWFAGNGDCYVEFGSGCYVESGHVGWSAFVLNDGGSQPPSSAMEQNTAVSGCSDWWWQSPVYKADAEQCGSHCQANNADACEWEAGSGDCYVEFGSGCYKVGHGGWWSAVYSEEDAAGGALDVIRRVDPRALAVFILTLSLLLAAGLVALARRTVATPAGAVA